MNYSMSIWPVNSRNDVELLEAVKMCIDAGFPALDLGFMEYSYAMADDYKKTAKELKALVDSHGVVFNQAHAPFGGGFEKYSTETFKDLPRVLEFAGLIGVKNIVVHPLQKIRYYGREEEMFELNMDFYSKLAPYAKNAGVKIGIENMWQQHPVTGRIVDDIGADPHELVRYYDTLNDPDAFTVCLDTGHVALSGREAEDSVRVIGHDRLGALHVHDVDYVDDLHTLPGFGKMNWDNICRALGEIDYIGDFTLEIKIGKQYPKEFLPTVLKFAADTAKFYSETVDKYRIKK